MGNQLPDKFGKKIETLERECLKLRQIQKTEYSIVMDVIAI
jgi:hypothetical protein